MGGCVSVCVCVGGGGVWEGGRDVDRDIEICRECMSVYV